MVAIAVDALLLSKASRALLHTFRPEQHSAVGESKY
jgi:hypothetical protein